MGLLEGRGAKARAGPDQGSTRAVPAPEHAAARLPLCQPPAACLRRHIQAHSAIRTMACSTRSCLWRTTPRAQITAHNVAAAAYAFSCKHHLGQRMQCLVPAFRAAASQALI